MISVSAISLSTPTAHHGVVLHQAGRVDEAEKVIRAAAELSRDDLARRPLRVLIVGGLPESGPSRG